MIEFKHFVRCEMYAHQVIDYLRNAKKNQEGEFLKAINSCLNLFNKAIRFHNGEVNNIIGLNLTPGKRIFYDDCKLIKFPYPCCWFDGYIQERPSPITKIGALIVTDVQGKIFKLYQFCFYRYSGWGLYPITTICQIGKNFTKDFLDSYFHETGHIWENKDPTGEIGNYFHVRLVPTPHKAWQQFHILNTATLSFVESVILLLNCKNIVTETINPPIKLNKKRIKQGKQPLLSYKILKVAVPINQRRAQFKGNSNIDNRVHLCRGHFKFYTKQKPLFGKISGAYWWQPHVRGQNRDGIVVKDYEVVNAP